MVVDIYTLMEMRIKGDDELQAIQREFWKREEAVRLKVASTADQRVEEMFNNPV